MEGEGLLWDGFLNGTAHPDDTQIRRVETWTVLSGMPSNKSMVFIRADQDARWDPVSLTSVARYQCIRVADPTEILIYLLGGEMIGGLRWHFFNIF